MKNVLKSIKPFMVKHQPEILMSMGIAGMIFSTVWAVKATNKAKDIVRNTAYNKWRDTDLSPESHKLSKKEVIKATWKLYIPVAVSMAVSIPCIIAGNRVSNKRNLALAAAYTLSETALQEYQEKTREIAGEKTEQKIHEAVSNDTVKRTSPGSTVLLTGEGDALFYEPLTDRYFKSNWNKISRLANEMNARSINDITGDVTLTEWLDALGLKSTDISDTVGWSMKDGVSGLIDITLDSALTSENVPCGAIYYRNRPKPFIKPF